MTVPPLLMLAQGRRPRSWQAPVERPKEAALHIDVARLLREHCREDWRWTHVPTGELRNIHTAVKLKKMGVRRGWPDFILVPPSGRMHCLELKRHGERLSEDQEAFRLWCIRNGVPYVVAYDFKAVLKEFNNWGCLRLKIGGIK